MRKIYLFLLLVLFAHGAQAQGISTDSVMHRLTSARMYMMALLEQGKKTDDPKAYDTMVLQHLALLYDLQVRGRILVHGQVLTDDRLTAMILFDTRDQRDVTAALAQSPLIRYGYMTYKVYRWFGEPAQFSTLTTDNNK